MASEGVINDAIEFTMRVVYNVPASINDLGQARAQQWGKMKAKNVHRLIPDKDCTILQEIDKGLYPFLGNCSL